MATNINDSDTAVSSSSTSVTSTRRQKQSEFNDGRQQPDYEWGKSFSDWIRQSFLGEYSDKKVEERLLSFLPFFPESDGKREAKIINTKLDNGNYIHEFYIENKEELPSAKLAVSDLSQPVKDVVLVHGYAASLGLFIDNFDSLSSVPGIKIHAIDLLGFGLSSRPKFPNFKSDTKEDIYKIEDWFIDAMEEWRIKRNINRFVLIGHSFGGYLSSAYVMKYNKKLIDASTKTNYNMIDKLILLSPVGVERSIYSLMKDENNSKIDPKQVKAENNSLPNVPLTREITDNQEDLIYDRTTNYRSSNEDGSISEERKIIKYLWRHNVSPFSIVRNLGPAKSKYIGKWTTHRFSHVYYKDIQHFQNVHDYMYRIFNGAGSGEYAITRVLDYGAVAKLPLVERIPKMVVEEKIPTLWLYGDKDWMNENAGMEANDEINRLSINQWNTKLSSFSLITNAGHHLYLDNPAETARKIFSFLNFRR